MVKDREIAVHWINEEVCEYNGKPDKQGVKL